MDRDYRQARWQSLGVSCVACAKNCADEMSYWCIEKQLCNRCYRTQRADLSVIQRRRATQMRLVRREIEAGWSAWQPAPPANGMLADVSESGSAGRAKTLI